MTAIDDRARLNGGYYDLRRGRWQDVLADVVADTVIVDPPYSDVTHSGHDSGQRDDASATEEGRTAPIRYAPMTPAHVGDFVTSWHRRCGGWFVVFSDHVLMPLWIELLRDHGRYVFAPLPFVELGGRVRLRGDGPSSWTCWVIVARPANADFARWGTLRGAYVEPARRGKPVMGGKPLGLMRQVVQDYSRRGDVVVDPCAGGATTLLAAVLEGRNAVGAESDQGTYEIGRAVLEAGHRGYVPPADRTLWVPPTIGD